MLPLLLLPLLLLPLLLLLLPLLPRVTDLTTPDMTMIRVSLYYHAVVNKCGKKS